MVDYELVDYTIELIQFYLTRLLRDIAMDKYVLIVHFGMKVMDWFQRTHPQYLKVRPFIIHEHSIVSLKVKVNETSLICLGLADFKVFFLPSLTYPADALIIRRFSAMSVAILDNVDWVYSLDQTGSDGNRNVPILFFYGMQIPLEINEAQVTLIMQPVYGMIVL